MYEKYRNEIKDGDILLYKGKGFVSTVIKKITKSEYSHAALAVWWNGRLMVLEAVGKGVIATPLSKNVSKYHGSVDWYSHKTISDEDRQKLVAHAQLGLGKEYSKWKLVILAYKLIFTSRDKKDDFKKENELFCSHFVAAQYNFSGNDLIENLSDSLTHPEDIAGATDVLDFRANFKKAA